MNREEALTLSHRCLCLSFKYKSVFKTTVLCYWNFSQSMIQNCDLFTTLGHKVEPLLSSVELPDSEANILFLSHIFLSLRIPLLWRTIDSHYLLKPSILAFCFPAWLLWKESLIFTFWYRFLKLFFKTFLSSHMPLAMQERKKERFFCIFYYAEHRGETLICCESVLEGNSTWLATMYPKWLL